MHISTGKGDTGTTQNFSGTTCPKSSKEIELSGAFDAAQTALGFAVVEARRCAEALGGASLDVPCGIRHFPAVLTGLQKELFTCAGVLAQKGKVFDPDGEYLRTCDMRTQTLSEQIELHDFVLPGGPSELAGRIDLARVAVRTLERSFCALAEEKELDSTLLPYLNRLSDLLFAMARFANRQLNEAETTL